MDAYFQPVATNNVYFYITAKHIVNQGMNFFSQAKFWSFFTFMFLQNGNLRESNILHSLENDY